MMAGESLARMGKDDMTSGLRSGSTSNIRAPLRATLIADHGPTKAKVIMMDEHRLQVLSNKQLVPGAVHRMRITLDGGESQVDVELRVERVQSGQDTVYKWGWLHHGVYREMDPDDSQVLTHELGSTGHAGSFTESSGPRGTTSEPVSADTSGMARRSGRARVVRVMARKHREDSVSVSRRNPKIGDRREALLKRVRRTPPTLRKGVPESLLVTPLYIPGPPAGLLAIFPSYQALAKALELDDSGVCVVLGGCEHLEVGDVVDLVMELPDKDQVQLMTMVLRKGDERDYLKANFVDPETLGTLRDLA